LETSLAMARVGVDGLNFHTTPAAAYRLFHFRRHHGRWLGHVTPIYYGLLAFTQVAPPGSRLLSTSAPPTGLPMWGTQTASGTIHVVLVNTGRRARTIAVRIPFPDLAPATLDYLRAPSLSSRTVTLDRQTFGAWTSTGQLPPAPKPITIPPVHGAYLVWVPAPSAALLTLQPQRSPAHYSAKVLSK
jgi:hypothetical protein